MKHLKSYIKQNQELLKSLATRKDDSEKFYVKIGESEYDTLYNGKIEKFKPHEILVLKKSYPKLTVEEERRFRTGIHYYNSISIKVPNRKYGMIECQIIKIPDEYYIVRMEPMSVYYKCDQIDGLLRLLKQKL